MKGFLLNLALSYKRKGNIQGAIREYETALDLAPDFKEAEYNLKMLYKKRGVRR